MTTTNLWRRRLLTASSLLALGVFSSSAAQALTLKEVASYSANLFDESAAEIVVYQPARQELYVVNGSTPSVDVLSFDGESLKLTTKLPLAQSEEPTSVAVHGDLIAVAVHDASRDDLQGKVVFFNTDRKRLGEVMAGALPDMVTFTPDGKTVLVANEGEQTDDMDPAGTISVIDVRNGVAAARVRHAGFGDFDAGALKKAGVRLLPGKQPAEDLEPEFITVSDDSRTAWISLQENNALAVLDIKSATVTNILPLGLKDHSKEGQGIDPHDKDGDNIGLHKIVGMYMPDGITSMTYQGKTFILTANEGDAREEDLKAKKATFDSKAYSSKDVEALGKIRVSTIDGDTDGDGDIDLAHVYGGRSFSIYDEDGKQVFDSGDDFERITARALGQFFNSDNDEANSGDKRSDNKGPEPEGVVVGEHNGKTYAFIGLERVGGIMIYDVSNPYAPVFQDYVNTRNFSSSFDFVNLADVKRAGPLGPEGLAFVPAKDSPTGKPLLMVAYEVSGTVKVFELVE
ncbi:MAG: alkaline phosphatase [Kordiimonas sp.]|nr:alkaline phosphatase [Kordiimonas sp.]|tara:strand:- start:1590 stop:3134 length:1545 start_codon:yes stop_codon:yes gene_type:complete